MSEEGVFAMLKFLGRMEKTRNFLLILFSVVLVASLIVFGALSGNQSQVNLAVSTETAASVDGEAITVGDIISQQEAAQRLMGQQRALPAESTAQQLIRQKLVKLEAARLGLTASDTEVSNRVLEIFKPVDGGAFDKKQYETSATRQAGSVSAFEESIRNSLSEEKLVAYVTSGVTVSEAEVLERYMKQNTKFDLSYVNVNAAEIAQNLNPSDDQLKEFFEKNKKDYYISLPQKKIRYIFLSTAKVGEKLEISDQELTAEYEKLPEERKRAGVNVQEIVLRVAKPEFDGEVLDKARRIIDGLKKGEATVSEKAFADTAQGQSERPTTASKGGRVPGLVKPAVDPSKQDDPYQRVLNMKEGEITEPLKYGSNYYILRRGAAVEKPFEDAKREIEVSLRNRKAYAANATLAGKVAEELKKTKEVQATAAKFASEVGATPADMIRETGFVKPGDDIKDLGSSQDFEAGIQNLEKANDVGDKIPVPGGFAVPLLVAVKEPRDAEFSEVKDKVAEAYKVSKARERLESIANTIAEKAGTAAGLGAAAAGENFKALESKDFTLGTPLGEGPTATTSEALEEAIYGLKVGELSKTPIKIGENYLIVGVTAREDADREDFEKQRDQLAEQMLTQERGRVYSDYLSAVNKRYESEKKIKIYKDALAKIDDFNQENAPPAPPVPPQGIPGGQQLPPELLEQLQRQEQAQ
ncbi:MAG: SurA N-terminal domain-containing protein [Acidobacteriota bacterium]|nr:SurA N-terminal domain-containing protein [Acidobacteriota bacterium]MDH3528221.1 SurA N-terminal domain-containing protein [Acidobacteriota bacterium]